MKKLKKSKSIELNNLHEIDKNKSSRENISEDERRFRAIAECTTDLFWEGDVREDALHWFGDIDGLLGYEKGEFPRTIKGHMESIHSKDQGRLSKAIAKSLDTGDDFHAEYRIRRKDGSYSYWSESGKAIGFHKGKAVTWVGAISDITIQKRTEEKLKMAVKRHKQTEKELLHTEQNLRKHTEELQESNIALKVLLKQQEENKQELEENILSNIKHLVLPYIEKLKRSGLQSNEIYLNIIESNLKDVISSFSLNLSSQYLSLTPKEITIANLIKEGRQDKDIAEILNISVETVKTHRRHIRKKLGIYKKKTNLRSYLLALIK